MRINLYSEKKLVAKGELPVGKSLIIRDGKYYVYQGIDTSSEEDQLVLIYEEVPAYNLTEF